MGDAGAELNLFLAQPGFQHQQQSSTNGLARQDERNATNDEKVTEKQESDATLESSRAYPCGELRHRVSTIVKGVRGGSVAAICEKSS
jgi:hypothetical protein